MGHGCRPRPSPLVSRTATVASVGCVCASRLAHAFATVARLPPARLDRRGTRAVLTPRAHAGDITNLVGALLSNQLPTQIYTAVLFITMDTFMISQLVYYSYCKKSGMRRPVTAARCPLSTPISRP